MFAVRGPRRPEATWRTEPITFPCAIPMPTPNILLIFADQHQARILGAYGDPVVQTPNLDRLASEGVLFRNAICAQPVCTPSRASLLTGTYGHTHGCIRNNNILTPEIPTIGEILGGHGYRCGYIGKWHIGNETLPQRGFEEFWCPTEDNYASNALRAKGHWSEYDKFLREHGYSPKGEGALAWFTQREACEISEEHHKCAFMAQQADTFFSSVDQRPFFLCMSFLEPHPPYFSPLDEMYSKDAVGLPPNYEVDDEQWAGWSRRHQCFRDFYYERGHNILTSDVDDVLANRARYYGLVTLLDRYVGKILDALEQRGLADDTIVLFTSDHGDTLGSHQMVDKGMMFDEAIKVPFILRHPDESFSAAECNAVVNSVDMLPTLLDMADLPVPSHIEGHSFLPVLKGEMDALPSFGIIEWNGILQNMHAKSGYFDDVLDAHVRCVVTERWKLVLSPGDRPELYDLATDPFETRNVFTDPANGAIVGQLFTDLVRWQGETNDTLDVPDPFAP